MKKILFWTLLFMLSLSLKCYSYSSDTLLIDCDETGKNYNIAQIINNDNGQHIYKLKRGGKYLFDRPVSINQPLCIVGATEPADVAPPLLMHAVTALAYSSSVVIEAENDVKLVNLYLAGIDENGSYRNFYRTVSDTLNLYVENCVCNYASDWQGFFRFSSTNGTAILKNNLVLNMMREDGYIWANWFHTQNSKLDTLIVTNNTLFNCPHSFLSINESQDASPDFALIEHNTLVNIARETIHFSYWLQLEHKNNLYYNAMFCGDINKTALIWVSSKFMQPDGEAMAYTKVDTIDDQEWLNDQLDEIGIPYRKVRCSHQNYYQTTQIRGIPDRVGGDSALTIHLLAEGSAQMFANDVRWPGLVYDSLTTFEVDPGFAKNPTDESALIDFAVSIYRDSPREDFNYDPDDNPLTFEWPIIGENGFIDFSYTNEQLLNASDLSLPLGDLYHWFPEAYAIWKIGGAIPVAPSGFIATDTSFHSVAIQWFDNAINEDGFVVIANEKNFTVTKNKTTYILDNLEADSNYTIKVYAYNQLGNSDTITIETRTHALPTEKPGAPESITLSDSTPYSVKVHWKDATKLELGHIVYLNNQPLDTLVHDTSYTISNLQYNTHYQIGICAYNLIGHSDTSHIDYRYNVSPNNTIFNGDEYRILKFAPENNFSPASVYFMHSTHLTKMEIEKIPTNIAQPGYSLTDTVIRIAADNYAPLPIAIGIEPISYIPFDNNKPYLHLAYYFDTTLTNSGSQLNVALIFRSTKTDTIWSNVDQLPKLSTIRKSWTDLVIDLADEGIEDGTLIDKIIISGFPLNSFGDMGDIRFTENATPRFENPFPPVAPTQLTITTLTYHDATFSWKDNSDNETGFVVFLNDIACDTLDANTTSYHVVDLAPETEYSFQVKAINAVDYSEPSNRLKFNTPSAPFIGAPTRLRLTDLGATWASLTWNDNTSNETMFIIVQDNTEVDTVPANVTSHTVEHLNPSQEYWFGVYACTENLKSSLSNVLVVTTLTTFNGIEQPAWFNIYPNPVDDKLKIESEFKLTWRIYTLEGKMILEGNNSELHLKDLSPGTYLLKVTQQYGKTGTVTFMKK